ncbi:hypothetical protein GGE07_001254 [Sinorhizobium terangae]|nr:hypothetical protein [Sinorhizobium terangae]
MRRISLLSGVTLLVVYHVGGLTLLARHLAPGDQREAEA